MIGIRPAGPEDLEGLLELAGLAGVGVTSLPADAEKLGKRLQLSADSFSGRSAPEDRFFLFALTNTENRQLLGVSGIEASVGLDEVWYNYRVSNTVHASRELNVHQQIPTLYLTNDMTGESEICSLFLHPDARGGANGHFLSKVRFLFMADAPELFSERVFAEMRGYSDESGHSPFWESLGKPFFSLEFPEADFLTGTGNKSFIAELMPKFPIYLPFLSQAAQGCVGQVHDQTRPALAMLRSEGFRPNGLVDIFDAGPVVDVAIRDIRCVRKSRLRAVRVEKASTTEAPVAEAPGASDAVLVSNGRIRDFRALLVNRQQLAEDSVKLTAEQARFLAIAADERIRTVSLKPDPEVL